MGKEGSNAKAFEERESSEKKMVLESGNLNVIMKERGTTTGRKNVGNVENEDISVRSAHPLLRRKREIRIRRAYRGGFDA